METHVKLEIKEEKQHAEANYETKVRNDKKFQRKSKAILWKTKINKKEKRTTDESNGSKIITDVDKILKNILITNRQFNRRIRGETNKGRIHQ